MSEHRLIEGTRATVAYGPVPGGYAWHCRGCGARAGMSSGKRRPNGSPFAPEARPFIDCEVNGRRDTAEGHCLRSARNHADKVCMGEKTRTWQPPNWTEPVEK